MSRIRRNPTSSLPAQFPASEYGLLTIREFLRLRDPDEKAHPSDAYDASLKSLNDKTWVVGWAEDWRGKRLTVAAPWGDAAKGLVFRSEPEGQTVAVLKDGVLYRDRFVKIRPGFFESAERQWRPLQIAEEREVKYPQELEPREDQRSKYPHLLQRVRVGGESFELRAEREPDPDQRNTIVVVNSKNELVAIGSDEWGATLLQVAREYRGRGLGKLLAQVWYEYNPNSKSGGFTAAGKANAIAAWEQRVRKWLALGWYSEMVRAGRLTKSRVNEILAGLSKGGKIAPSIPVEPVSSVPDLRIYVDDGGVAFVLYDARFLDDPDERYILGHGFLRDTKTHGVFFYRIEYEPKYAEFVSAIGLQLARDFGAPLYVDAPPADIFDWKLVPFARYNNGYVTLSQDVLSLRDFAKLERRLRHDPYRQRQFSLLEVADAKWT
jgi:GNAT superfamily N-acetyltransferase